MANTALLFFKPTTQKDTDFSSTYHFAFLCLVHRDIDLFRSLPLSFDALKFYRTSPSVGEFHIVNLIGHCDWKFPKGGI